jgi:hypothetical protein
VLRLLQGPVDPLPVGVEGLDPGGGSLVFVDRGRLLLAEPAEIAPVTLDLGLQPLEIVAQRPEGPLDGQEPAQLLLELLGPSRRW